MKTTNSTENLPTSVQEELSSGIEDQMENNELLSRIVTKSGERLSDIIKREGNSKLSKKLLKKYLSNLSCFN